MRLKNKTNKQKLPLWRQPAASLPSLHPGLSGSLLEPDLPTPGVRVGLGRGAGDRSLLAHTCLAGMQHHLKKERQLLQGNIHHLSWEKVGKKSQFWQPVKWCVCLLLGWWKENTAFLSDWGKESARTTTEVKQTGLTFWYLAPFRCPRESSIGASYNYGYYTKNTNSV